MEWFSRVSTWIKCVIGKIKHFQKKENRSSTLFKLYIAKILFIYLFIFN